MMQIEQAPRGASQTTRWGSLAFKVGTGAIAGFFGALGLLTLMGSGALGTLDPSREIAALVGLIYLLSAAVVGLGLLSPGIGARLLNVEDAAEIGEMRAMLVWSTAGTFAIAAVFMFAAFAAPAGTIPAPWALAGIVVSFALAWYAGHRQRRHVDELMRTVSSESVVLAFYLSVMFGGGWALLSHLEMVAGPSPIDWLSMFGGFMLLACFVVIVRRGMVRAG
ncbi:hypothetical protein [Qipengyuania sp. MTN3-11]|uniref:hypothetical protein n=1 Tax=Qipengyuania sp. MTN3-11 TaxID=3056557 RepID=UPI0036F3BA06